MRKQTSKNDLFKRKKLKTSHPTTENEKTEKAHAEILDIQGIREGMILLGCVTEVRSSFFLMSLPGCLIGRVPIMNISKKFTESLIHSTQDDEASEVSLASVVEVGFTLPCKVLQVTTGQNLKKPTILLSVDPQEVNAELRMQSLYLKMVLFSCVQSAEDHGYVMDMGIKGAQGFLPFSACGGNKDLTIGQVIPTSVRKLPSHKKGSVVWLSKLTFNDEFVEIDDDNLSLTSIIPGVNLSAYITEVKHPFLYMRCLSFMACASVMSIPISSQKLAAGDKVSGTVLYVHPITHMIYLSLSPRPSPDSFQTLFPLQKFNIVKNLKYQYFWHHRLVFRLNKGAMGFVKKYELSQKGSLSQDSLAANPVIPRARVMFLHYMDNLVQLSLNKSLIDLEIIQPQDVTIGFKCEGTVSKHIENGMFVSICPGLSGFVRNLQLSDAPVTMPEKLCPVNSKVECRVLTLQPSLALTCKESLVNLPDSDILTSYEEAQPGCSFKGVIVLKANTHLLVAFFNDVKGLVPSSEIPGSSLLFVGQTVLCRVLRCSPDKRKMLLSLKSDDSSLKTKETSNLRKASKQLQASVEKPLAKEQYNPQRPYKAVIKSITGHQLNIMLDSGVRGRVHLTEITNTTKELSHPLTEFSAGQCINVHVFDVYDKKSKNFLVISHRNTNQFLECSLKFPPPVALEKEFIVGMSVTGFVKEVSDTCAKLWLSPVQTATLEYLHMAQNPKVLRKLRKKLKTGLSVNADVLEVERISKDAESFDTITLTKLENNPVQKGSNIVGLVQIACPEKGLVLKLPYGYHGFVSLTDIQDIFIPLHGLLEKYRKLGFILCHVLDVNMSTKFCNLSLRKSRLYGHQDIESNPELTTSDFVLGKSVAGYVKNASDDHLIVNFGRLLDGKVLLHKCETYGCNLCKHTQSIRKKYTPGEVIRTKLEGSSATKGLYPLSLPELHGSENSQQNRLHVAEDIDWNDL